MTNQHIQHASGIETIVLKNVEVQANGIIRNEKGRLIARLVDGVEFSGEHIFGLKMTHQEKHDPMCKTNMRCAVYHENGICPDADMCTCQKTHPDTSNKEKPKVLKEVWYCDSCGKTVTANGEHLCEEKQDWEKKFDKQFGDIEADDDGGGIVWKDRLNQKENFLIALKSFIRQAITKAREEEQDKCKKLLNSGKAMYELGKKEERERYDELIMAVEMKHEGETRHQTALRYIKQAEQGDGEVKQSISPQD